MRTHVLAATLVLTACGGTYDPSDPGGTPDAAPVSTPDAAPGTPDAPPTPGADAAAEGLTVQFDTTPNGGPYAPKNIVAVWIEGPGGAFEKTIGRWSATRTSHLVAWVLASGQDTDAVSGATRPSHTQRLTVTWDLKDKAGQVVPDGTYTIRMELADSNATQPAQNHQGTFTFDKNGTAATQNVSGNGFNNVAIDYTGR
jgi:hypothetical protein